MLALIEFRRSTSAEWAAYNPVLGPGEPGLDITRNVLKIGDGVTAWAALPTFATGEAQDGTFTGDILWTDIGNKPTAFTPAAHTHISDDVTDLSERVQDLVASMLVAGTNISTVYSDSAGTLTISSTGGGGTGGTGGSVTDNGDGTGTLTAGSDPESIRDTIAAALVGAGLISITANDAGDTITISTVATQNQADSYLLSRANHTGTESADVLTDGSTNRLYSTAEKTKLAGVATAATANQTDAYLLARVNHTGSQTAATISDFSTAADARAQAWTKKVVTWATGAEPSLSGVPDGTLWVEYTP